MRLPSGSKLALAEKCAYPWVTDEPWPKEPDSPAAQLGKAAHKCAENYTMGIYYTVEQVAEEHEIDARDLLPLERDARRILDADAYEWREAEVVIALNPMIGEVRRAKDRFDKRDGEQILIADLIMGGADWLVVRDWKTGKPKPEAPHETAQMRACGWAAAKLYGHDECAVELAYLGRFRSPMSGPLDSLDLMSIELWLSSLVRSLPRRPNPTPGHWCYEEWCVMRSVCDVAWTRKKRTA